MALSVTSLTSVTSEQMFMDPRRFDSVCMAASNILKGELYITQAKPIFKPIGFLGEML
jgi:hypothetical protein